MRLDASPFAPPARTALAGLFFLGALGTVTAFAQEAAPAAAAAPVPDKGDTAWMLVSTILVILMTIPGLALFYGGLVRAKNVLSVLMQVFAGFAMIALLWVAYGYSLAFTGAGTAEEATALTPFIGGLSKVFLAGVGPSSLAETFSEGVFIPELTFVVFQLTFAAITPALIIGAVAERMRFGSVMFFLALWFTFAYLPIAHMVWWWGGPSAASAPTGYLFGIGALDFAGGTVVHINSGVAGLVAALVVGPRVGFLKENMAPHNLTFTLIGACLLWVGWFGFNAGSNLEANGLTAQALLNTITATSAAALAWSIVERITRGHASLLGAASGAVAGLVAITPAAGLAGTGGAILLGAVAGAVCLWAVVSLKPMLKYDDSLDVFGIHGVGGIVGALGTAIVAAPALGGFGPGAEDYSIAGQFGTQFWAVIVAVVWSAVVAFVALQIVKAVMGLRLPEAGEREGLDITSHGERAYN
ncbi:ammonium transporter [Mesorhizobium sp. L-8-3]|uniref:ammonium transporter n=1 Tax=Mesorhizobium sp. L-8-3 TaxID=2744522 RepID=UPI00193826D6|nr:ammonium transporter [Mesorhizobium sp. L-8-3]BCH22295.1 ammonium transporter [Mesorhizobium sp. L-8-3]